MENLSWVVIITALLIFSLSVVVSYKIGRSNGYHDGASTVLNEWKKYMGNE